VQPRVEPMTFPAGTSMRVFERRARTYPFYWHHHPEYELTYIRVGRGRRFVGDHAGPYEDGELVLIGPWLPHTWASEDRRAQWAVVYQFPAEWIDKLIAASPELAGVESLLKRSDRGLLFRGDIARTQGERLRRALAEDSPLARMTTLLHVLDDLRHSTRPQPLATPRFAATSPPLDERIQRVHRFLQQHFTADIAQPDLAKLAGMTPEAFSRFFHRSTGRTLVNHLHELRIGRACQLLQQTTDPITDICFACGFNNLSNFNRVFRRLRGTTPSAYRKQFSSDVES